MNYSRYFLAAALSLAGTAAFADTLDINLHSDALRASYGRSAGRGLEWDVGHFFNEDDETVTHAGLHVSGENWSKAGVFDIGLGGRVVFVRTDPENASAIALGARVRFSPVRRVGIGGNIYHAPDIITFGEGESYTEASVQLDYQLLPQAFVYLGYRDVKMDFDDVDEVDIDTSGHLGMRLLW